MKKSLISIGVGACLAVSACSKEVSQPIETMALSCPEIVGADDLLSQAWVDLIVFGEMHGMEEGPRFVADMLCHDIKANGNTVLALEYSKDMSADINTYLAQPDETKALHDLLSTDAWSKGMQDGRKSMAMMGLITAVKKLQLSGHDASIAMFISGASSEEFDPNMPRSVMAQRHEKNMADNLIKIVDAHKSSGKGGHVLALAGSVHARRGMGEFTTPPYDLMAKLLPEASVLTLMNNYRSGTAWNCTSRGDSNAIDCAGHSHSAYLANVFKTGGGSAAKRAIHLFDKNIKGYDGYFYIGTSTASSPAMVMLEQ